MVVFFLYLLLLFFCILWVIIKFQGEHTNRHVVIIYEWLKENLFFNPFYELGLEGFIELLILVFLQLAHQKQ